MVHKYLENKEENTDLQTEIANLVRLNVTTDAEAETLYGEYKEKFTSPKGIIVDGDHVKDDTGKPCEVRKIKTDGKIEVISVIKKE